MVQLKAGSRLFSAVCTAEMMAVKVPAGDAPLTIGGVPPVSTAAERTPGGSPVPGHDTGVLMGKRYVDHDETIELLCTKPGPSAPALNGILLVLKEAKALPASD